MASMLATKTASRSAVLARPSRATRSRRQVVCKAERQTWFIGAEAPSYLNGSLAGDFGFDPLGLGEDAGRLKWYVEAEKTNGRWAMMGVAGILGQELLGVTPKWFEAGAKEYDIPTAPLLAIEFLVLGFLELKRLQGYRETGTSGLINSFPFDPVGLNSPDNALKEIKNGRLAMISFVAFCTQALVTRTGPIEGLSKHMASPLEYNLIGNINNLPSLIN